MLSIKLLEQKNKKITLPGCERNNANVEIALTRAENLRKSDIRKYERLEKLKRL